MGFTIGHRSPGSTLGGVAAAVLATLGAQAYYAGHRDLPSFGDLDPSGAWGAPDAPPLRITAVGDSTCTGPGLDDPDDIWLRILARRFADRFHVEVRSHAVGGSKARDVIDGQLEAAVADRPDVAVVAVGSNDALRGTPLPRLRRELTTIVEALAPVSGLVVLPGVGDLGTIPRLPRPLRNVVRARSRMANRVHRQVAARFPNAVKVPIWHLAADPYRRWPDMFSPDRFHPSVRGHAVWADAAYVVVASHLDTVLGSRAVDPIGPAAMATDGVAAR